MKTLTKLMLSAALAASFAAAPAMAGPMDIVKDKAKSEAKKEVRKEMKSQATDKVITMTGVSEPKAGMAVDGAEKAMEMTGVIDKAVSEDDDILSSAVNMAKDGISVEEPPLADANAESSHTDKMMQDAKGMAMDKVTTHKKMDYINGNKVIQKGSSSMTETAAPALPPVACPAGTTAQPNGTCMITGDFNPG